MSSPPRLGPSIATLRAARTRCITPENPDGSPGGGARATEGPGAWAARELGRGWKVSPYVDIAPGESCVVADIGEQGRITHLWMTTGPHHWRSLVLRAFWDGEADPAVEVPYGDFFCNGWARFAQVSSWPIAANPHGGFNSYWPMPFHRGARLTVDNLADTPARLFFAVTYETGESQAEEAYLHTQWRRSNPLADRTPHAILKGVTGRGHYVGTYLAWASNSPGWWGEGEVKFYLDGDTEFPSICTTGTEDYFGGAWNFDVPGQGYTPFTTPYLGMPQVLRPDGLYDSQQRFGMYRWHVQDPVFFTERLTVTVQGLGWRSGGRYRTLRDDIASTAWFYLDRPATARPGAPTADGMEVGGAEA